MIGSWKSMYHRERGAIIKIGVVLQMLIALLFVLGVVKPSLEQSDCILVFVSAMFLLLDSILTREKITVVVVAKERQEIEIVSMNPYMLD